MKVRRYKNEDGKKTSDKKRMQTEKGVYIVEWKYRSLGGGL